MWAEHPGLGSMYPSTHAAALAPRMLGGVHAGQVRDMKEGEEVWIAKPSLTNQALSVCIFDRVAALRAALEAAPDLREWVLQR